MMAADLDYSPDAYNVLSQFYHTQAIVYVEGESDVLYWDSVFSCYTKDFDYIIEDVGGCKELDKKIDLIINYGVNIIVARDSDYLFFKEMKIDNPNIIYTYGHSLENSLYCKKNLNRFSRNLYQTARNFENDFQLFLEKLCDSLFILIVLEICNFIYDKGIEILGDNLYRLLNSDGFSIDEGKKKQLEESKRSSFSDAEINNVIEFVKKYDKPKYYLIRGHCLTSVLINFIRKGFDKYNLKHLKTVTDETFYAGLIDGCKLCSNFKQCAEQKYLKEMVERAVSAVVKNR